ncbi:phage terminase large subunit family protein [Mesorhizobium sp. J428]|uniref:phage terminase large subunit family protein n=1 Tax=Mesorhizobium sp. J428 TaxID=2898440 RepID=UPI002150A8EC|nr:phage terminase large subunit family protein [Mesorhizobium sp. J428]MCR5859715.1 phage terminase large subunit family protein [Mesorhizobium sp. J428]
MLDQAWRRFLPDTPPPPFASAEDVIRDALPTLQPRRRITVPQWAEQSRLIDFSNAKGRWSNAFTPYMTEPSTMVTSRRFGAVVFVGPARAIKSEPLILNTIGHAIECKPRDTMVVCQTQDSAKQFSERKLGPMLRHNPQLMARQLTGRGADNIHEKKFEGGMNLQIRWPVIGNFSQNEYFSVLLTDRDRMTDDVDGEGDPFTLARKRVQHAGSLGIVVEESSPGRPIERDDWEPSTHHEAPPCAGILSDYNLGTRGKFYWCCPHCGDAFTPIFERLKWDSRGTESESAKTVCMVCPSGCVIGPDRKNELNAGGIWLHETADGGSAVPIDDPAVRDTDIASYWCEGPVAAMQSWEQLVLRYLQAKASFDERGDEKALLSTVTLDQGRPYLPAVRQIGEGLSVETLKALAEGHALGELPAATRFVTVQVDVQSNRFVVSVEAWGQELEHWLVDRFDISTPPAGAPGAEAGSDGKPRRAIDPPRYFEDWAALRPLLDRSWPVSGSDISLMPRALIVDSGGAAGVTQNAYKFLRAMQRQGLGGRVFLAKGHGGLDRQRAVYGQPEKVLGTRKKRTTDLRIVVVGTDPLKDEVALSLTRREPGPNAYHLPRALTDTVFAEFCAEVRTDTGWQVRKQGLRNEAFDLAVYAKALAIVLKAEKIDWSRPPAWAADPGENSFAVRVAAPTQTAPAPPTPVVVGRPRGRRVRSRGI